MVTIIRQAAEFIPDAAPQPHRELFVLGLRLDDEGPNEFDLARATKMVTRAVLNPHDPESFAIMRTALRFIVLRRLYDRICARLGGQCSRPRTSCARFAADY